MAFESGQFRQVGGPITYYLEYTTTNLYVAKTYGSTIRTITVSNDDTNDTVQVSFDNATLEGDIKAGETKDFLVSGKPTIYIKATTGGGKVRIWGS